MNYYPIVINAYTENKKQKTSFQSYFKRESKLAERDNFVELEDFFKGCLYIVECYKNEIIRLYNERYNENNLALHLYKQAIQRGETLDDNGEPIQKHIDYIINDKLFVESRGYKNNYDYACSLTATGDITNDFLLHEFKLHWQDIEEIEQGILKAQSSIQISVQPATINNSSESLSYKQYSSFEEALKSCTIQDKILLHSINNYCNPCYIKPIDVFNDILMFRTKYLDDFSYCLKYFKERYKHKGKETYVVAHILRSEFNKKSDFILLFEGYENENFVKEFEAIKNTFRKKLTVNFDLFAGVLLKDPNDPNKICTTHTITDELALHHLSINPECKNKFSVLPENLDKLLKEYQNQNSDEKKTSKTSKKQSNQQVKERRTYNFEELKSYFKPEFWGVKGTINYFDILVSDLKPNRVPKEFAEIALMIFDSKYMNDRKPVYFKVWYNIFCECIDCEQKKYNKKDLFPPRESLKKLFGYLLD